MATHELTWTPHRNSGMAHNNLSRHTRNLTGAAACVLSRNSSGLSTCYRQLLDARSDMCKNAPKVWYKTVPRISGLSPNRALVPRHDGRAVELNPAVLEYNAH
ncbi:unnamed protein product, partial [Ectocarpus sp. 12 AP-2014]